MINKKAFTLIELIVSIMILAILGTIAFISLQNYTKEARDAKRIQDVNNLLKVLLLENTKGIPYVDMLKDVGTHEVTINGSKYIATQGTIDFKSIKTQETNFLDPKYNTNYEFAISNGITKLNGVNQKFNFIQGRTISEKDGEKEIILGNYYEYKPGIDSVSLFTGSINIIDSKYSCDYSIPNILNIETIVGKPNQINQSWQNIDSKKACYYKCINTYAWNLTKTECEKLPYFWKYTEFTQCNVSEPVLGKWSICPNECGISGIQNRNCDEGTGNKTRIAKCYNSETNVEVNDSYCNNQNGLIKEDLIITCQTNLCNTTGYETTKNCDIIPCPENGICGVSNNTDAIIKPEGEEACEKGIISILQGNGPWTWTCLGRYGGIDSSECKTNTFCSTQPNYENAEFTIGTPNKANQEWLKDGKGGCYYACKKNYSGEACDSETKIDIDVPPIKNWTLERKHATHSVSVGSDYVDIKYNSSTHSGLDYYFSLGKKYSELNYIKLKYTAAYWGNGYYGTGYHNDGFSIVPCVRDRNEPGTPIPNGHEEYYFSRSIQRCILGVPFLRYPSLPSSFNDSLYKTYEIEFNFKTLAGSCKVDGVTCNAVDIVDGRYGLMNFTRTYIQSQNDSNIFLNKYTKISQKNYANDIVCLDFSMSDYSKIRTIRVKDFEILELY